MSNDARQKNYKHRGLDSEELRKRREDLNITLRKQKREEQVRHRHDYKCCSLTSICSSCLLLVSSYSNDEI
jgi:hypothetical protein